LLPPCFASLLEPASDPTSTPQDLAPVRCSDYVKLGSDYVTIWPVTRDNWGVGGEWPLVGRASELRQIRGWLARRDTGGVVLAGAAGVGKSRLALEGLKLAEEAGCATVRIAATQSSVGLPFGAFASFLPAAEERPLRAADNRTDLLRRSAAALVERAGGRQLVLLVDDAHLLDEGSATLIHQLVATGDAFVVATVRVGDPAPDSVIALWKDGLVERLEVQGLGIDQTRELLAAVLGGPADPGTATRLARRSRGNALFLRELVLGALQDGTLRNDRGIWRLVGSSAPSERLVELVETRLTRLNDDERALLEVVSFGEPLGTAELVTLGSQDLAEGLERKGLLASRSEGGRLQIRLAHPLHGEVLRTRTPAVRSRAIARSLAEAVEATGTRRREDGLRVATWRLDGGGARPDLMVAAATTARWRYDFELAERLARAALAAGAGFDAALLATELSSVQGRGSEAEAELASLAARAMTDADRGRVAIARLENSAFYLGQIDEGLHIAEDAEAVIVDPRWRDEIAARRSALLLGARGPKVAAEAAQPLLATASGGALAWACRIAAYSLGRLGHVEAAVDTAIQGHAVHLTLTRPLDWYPWTHIFIRCEVLANAGRFEEAQALATDQYQRGLAEGSAEAQAWFAWQLGKVVGDRGHVQTAAGHLQEAVSLFHQLGWPQFTEWCLAYLALALALAGRNEEAAEALQTLEALRLPPNLYMGTDFLQARAWVLASAGNLPRARQTLEKAASLGEDIGDLVGQAAALHGLARLGRAKDVATRLATLAGHMEGGLAPARAAHAQALAHDDAAGLTEVSGSFEAMGAHLLAAEAAADAAVAWRRAGQPRAAGSAERRAALLADRAEGASTPALQAAEPRSRLTPAERETALLAAAGRSNKEIAEQLTLAVRSVETRLQRIYNKLGISSRGQLAAALDRPSAVAQSRLDESPLSTT
jgi:DNA-binding CsgD family transcriptional regulator